MKLNIFILLAISLIFNESCSIPYFLSEHEIKFEYPFYRNFEISKLKVDSIHAKTKYPVKYDKEMIYICSIDYKIDSTQSFFNKQYQSVEDYWKGYDNLDSLCLQSNRKVKNVLFFEKQNHINWIKYPFLRSELSPILPIVFEKNRWYKLSHFNPASYDFNLVIFFKINDKGKLISGQLIED